MALSSGRLYEGETFLSQGILFLFRATLTTLHFNFLALKETLIYLKGLEFFHGLYFVKLLP